MLIICCLWVGFRLSRATKDISFPHRVFIYLNMKGASYVQDSHWPEGCIDSISLDILIGKVLEEFHCESFFHSAFDGFDPDQNTERLYSMGLVHTVRS
jgi:hypothetical protein